MSKVVLRPTKEVKVERVEAQAPAPKMHPAAESWNAFIKQLEETRELWLVHQATYLKTKTTIGNFSRDTQVHLAGILHAQKFEFVLDYMVKYANSGYLPLIIKE